jgi:hypothetical protein
VNSRNADRCGAAPQQESEFEEAINTWFLAADKGLALMFKGGDPNKIDEHFTRTHGRPTTYLEVLYDYTRDLAVKAARRDDRFRPEKLLEFAGAILRWMNGYCNAADYVAAATALDIAKIELIHLLGVPKLPVERAGRGKASEWEVDRQILETIEAVGHRLTQRKLLSNMTERYGPVAESTVKKRAPVMLRQGRLTKDPNASPPGYGLPKWDGSPGS